MRFPQACRLMAWVAIAPVLLGGCSIFRPAVEVHALTAREAIELKRSDILTRDKLSDATIQTIRVAALDVKACAKPISSECVEALAAVTGIATDRRLAALSELWLAQAQAMEPGSVQQAAWLETIRYAYAYLFLGDHTPGERAFEDRQTQVRDWYNYAVEHAAAGMFEIRQQMPAQLTPQQIKRIDSMLHFEPVPNVSSAIFIAAPHRGTSIAGGRLGRWMAGFIRFPITMLEELAHTLAPNVAASSRESLGSMPNSVDNLDENDPFVRTAAGFPISSQVRYHSIVAQADPQVALVDSDDGLVPYRSAHLPGAQSEKVITSGHSVQQDAAAILEIQRILRKDMALRGECSTQR